MKQRENALDFLRIISAIFVIAVHTFAPTLHSVYDAADKAGVKDFSYYFYKSGRTLFEVAVPIFIMLSGAFVLAAKSTMEHKSFYQKMWKKLCIPTIIFSVIYFFGNWFTYYHSGMYAGSENPFKDSLLGEVKLFLSGKPAEHMWYMFMLIVLYLMAPFVVRMREAFGEKGFTKAAWILYIWGTIGNYVMETKLYWGLDFAINMLGIFMLGYVAHEWGKKNRGKKSGIGMLLAGLAISAIHLMVSLFVPIAFVKKIFGNTLQYNPLIILAAFFYVAAFTTFEFKKSFATLSAATYWVYLVHVLMITVVFLVEEQLLNIPYAKIGVEDIWLLPMINVVLISVSSFVVAIGIDRILAKRKSGKVVTR